jgi:SAM-dependent MidA family methyltransferase
MENYNINALPEPDDEAKQRSRLLVQCVKSACDANSGWINFSEFMNITLYQPNLGYYTGGLQKFGAKGDFITAPEVSPLFGQCIALQLADILNNFQAKSHQKTYVLEFGAGSGLLALDVLQQLESLDALPDKYLIVELSAELKQRQQKTIKDKSIKLFERVKWLDHLPDDLSNVVVIANEVLDAMPVENFKVSKSNVESLMISIEDDNIVSQYVPASGSVEKVIAALQQRSEFQFADDYCSEYNPAIHAWLSLLESKSDKMVVLLIDYGYNEKEYYHADRSEGTLMCYYQHRAHSDFSFWPGLQDITAFVNFTDVAYSAVDLGLEVAGYTTQAAFLLSCGLSDLHESQVGDDIQQQVKLSQQIKTLTLPSEMGDRFKVIALTKNYDEPLKGFSMLDLRNRL